MPKIRILSDIQGPKKPSWIGILEKKWPEEDCEDL